MIGDNDVELFAGACRSSFWQDARQWSLQHEGNVDTVVSQAK